VAAAAEELIRRHGLISFELALLPLLLAVDVILPEIIVHGIGAQGSDFVNLKLSLLNFI
jgi:hypothetical protein